jgi:beta-lactamase regulating signal transducer with metallopeptidase domain
MSGFTWMGDAFALRVAATLLHFVWQGLALALIAGLLIRSMYSASARARYSVNVGLLLAMVVCLPVRFAVLDGSTLKMARSNFETSARADVLAAEETPFVAQTTDSAAATPQFAELDAAAISPQNRAQSGSKVLPDGRRASLETSASRALHDGDLSRRLTSLAPFITWTYLVGVLFMTARLVVGLRGGQSLRRQSLPVEDAGLLAMVRAQAKRIGRSCVPAVAFCERISVPMVIGIMRPMILLPATLVSGLSPDQLQALVTHELSHIRRYDLLVNLLQRIVETVLFFHPAVWLVSRRISMERENVADDAVLAAGWPAVRYADASVRMAELSSTLRTPSLTVQVAAGSSSSEFNRRVIRLLDGSSSFNWPQTMCRAKRRRH